MHRVVIQRNAIKRHPPILFLRFAYNERKASLLKSIIHNGPGLFSTNNSHHSELCVTIVAMVLMRLNRIYV